MKEPLTTISITNSDTNPNLWCWSIKRGAQTFISGGPESTEPKTYGAAQSAAEAVVRAYGRIVQKPYQVSGG